MTEEAGREAVPIPADQMDFLIATAARAPSVHNTQPWRFRVGEFAIELYADTRRKLRADPIGREMLISCGAALFGLRLAVRSLGYLPLVELLPDPAQLRLLARVRLGAAAPMTARERQMIEAVPHRHTHRGPFDPGPLPAGLFAGLQHDAVAEGATLAPVDPGLAYGQLADIVGAAGRRQHLDPAAQADTRRWSRAAADPARDGVPTHAFPASTGPQHGRLPQRDFDLGRGLGLLPAGGPPPAVTAVLLTPGDGRADWLRAWRSPAPRRWCCNSDSPAPHAPPPAGRRRKSPSHDIRPLAGSQGQRPQRSAQPGPSRRALLPRFAASSASWQSPRGA